MEVKRRKLQGVLNILSFNRHFYFIGLIVLFGILYIFSILNVSSFLFWLITVAFIYGLVMPLLVSAYVYDYSGYYNFSWLNKYKLQDAENNMFININAGFDETSYIIKNKFPKSKLQVFDFYNPDKHTEPAIVRARKVSLVYPETKQINTSKIPLSINSADVIFLLSAAHEIRNNTEKLNFFKECYRVCKPKGKVIIVDHLRDVPNFFAFSVGFTHFFSKQTWIHVLKKSGFHKISEEKFTPFMSVFSVTK